MENHSKVKFVRCFSLHGIVSHLFHWVWELGDITEHVSLKAVPLLVVRSPCQIPLCPFLWSLSLSPFEAATTTETWASRANGNMDILSHHPLALYVLSLRLHRKGKCKLHLTFSLLRICYNRDLLFSRKKKTRKDILWNLTPRESSWGKQISFISF